MRSIRPILLVLSTALVLAACGTAPELTSSELPELRTAAITSATIDFEANLAGGDYVMQLGAPTMSDPVKGITFSGPVIYGPISVLGERIPSTDDGNYARIFDSTCGGGTEEDCTGGDSDLYAPAQGNTLIVQELGATEPDDSVGEVFTLDFTGFGPTGSVDVVEFFYIDVEEEGANVKFYDGDGEPIYDVTTTEDGESKVWPEGVSDPAPSPPIVGVSKMVVTFVGSGAIDDIVLHIPVEEEPSDGCTPGYWKQPHHFDSWQGYEPADSYSGVFGIGPDITLIEALEARGNRNGEALLRHSVAALLNAANDDVSYAYTEGQVLEWTKSAWDGALDVNETKDVFAVANEAGCDLN